ncbi:Cell surface glycoprotein 1 [Gracilariopsis chorda]|uniref:Cell surface glycoprotein 1 n=1 Tax=Gracilariopsis chorda TaxID=448386 RepID=A0A2V3IFA2_9FLOR|nr:Cell surface glycoprotein 1 [Gracilariopsis chorda]|eukprot:PXF40754.1 Cell surface glycoprotein 1 [Gracilariopsis chorda]
MQHALSAAVTCVEALRVATDCASCSGPTQPLWCAVCRESLCACNAAQHQSHRHALLPNRQCAHLLTRVRALCRWARLKPSSSSASSRPHSALVLRVRPPSPAVRLRLRLRRPRLVPLRIRVKNACTTVESNFSDRTTQTPPPVQQREPSSTASPPASNVHSDRQHRVPSSPSPSLRSNTLPVSAPANVHPISPDRHKSRSPQSATKQPPTPSHSPSTVTKRPRSAPQPPNTNSHTPLHKKRKQQQHNLLQHAHTSEPLPRISTVQVSPPTDAEPPRHPSVTTISLQDSPQSKTNHSPQQPHPTRTARQPVATPEKPLPHTPAQNDAADDKLSEGTTNPGGRDDADMEDPVTPLQPTSTAKPRTPTQTPPEPPPNATRQLKHSNKSEWKTTQSHLITSPLTTLKPKQQPQCLQTPIALKTNQPSSKPDNMRTHSPAFFVYMSDFTDQQQYDLVFELVTQMGGEPLPNLASTRPNCLITPLHPTTGAIQTRKMAVLLAIALRVPIVGLTWLFDCFNAGTWLPLQPYDASSSFHRTSSGVFKGVIATIDHDFEQPDASDKLLQFRNDIKRLITSADGVVVQLDYIKEHLKTNPDSEFFLHIHVVKDQNEDEFVMSPQVADDKLDLIRKHQSPNGFTIVNMNWISECLFTGQCPPPERSETVTRSTQSPTVSHSQGYTAP